MQVVLAWGGWTCNAGYTHWAYVAKFIDCKEVSSDCPGSEKIGERIYEPPYRAEITNPKNCSYNDEPEPFPKGVCLAWITKEGHDLMTTVKLRTD